MADKKEIKEAIKVLEYGLKMKGQIPMLAPAYELAIKALEEIMALKDDNIPIIHGKAELEEHDKKIRTKAIDELKNKICMHFADWQLSEDDKLIKDIIELASESVEEIAEQMKGK